MNGGPKLANVVKKPQNAFTLRWQDEIFNRAVGKSVEHSPIR